MKVAHTCNIALYINLPFFSFSSCLIINCVFALEVEGSGSEEKTCFLSSNMHISEVS